MKTKWEEVVKDPKEQKVFEALADPKWDYRTIEGLVEATGLSIEDISSSITKYRSLIRIPPVRDKYNRQLYTLSTKKQSVGEILNTIRGTFSKST